MSAELIVTQWDVNAVTSVTVAPNESELIVTQWDVNSDRLMQHDPFLLN